MEITAAQLAHTYSRAHGRFRETIAGLSTEELNWSPHPEANSIAVLVVHSLGSERWNLRAVRGMDNDRDRDAEFKTQTTAAELSRLLDGADEELAEHVAAIDSEALGLWGGRSGGPTAASTSRFTCSSPTPVMPVNMPLRRSSRGSSPPLPRVISESTETNAKLRHLGA